MRQVQCWSVCVVLAAALVLCGAVQAQVVEVHYVVRPIPAHIIVPQSRVYWVHHAEVRPVPSPAPPPRIEITQVSVNVGILEQAATTAMDISVRNPSPTRIEAELMVPVPEGAIVRGFTFQGAAKEPTAEILPKDEARRIYNEIVSKTRDPALLEFVGYNLIRSSVFPVDANGTQKVRLTYENLLLADGNRVDYVLPRTESIDYSVPWDVTVTLKSKQPISTVYSPSHKLDVTRKDKNVVVAQLAKESAREPGAFRFSCLLEQDAVTASLLAYPDPKIGGGYFLLLAGLPAKTPKDAGSIKREVILVLDRSGSMRDEKIEQVREAAAQVISGLDDGEAFNIIAYNDAVDLFAARPVLKSAQTAKEAREYLKGVQARGGTNIHDALLEALRQKPTEAALPIVLFLTDGIPTVGQMSEKAIREVATKANQHKRRVFTFGVGFDVNTPLLEHVALDTRATSTFVLPKEDVEVKVGAVFKRLSGPILADPRLEAVKPDGTAAPGRTRDVLPAGLPDLFEGDQLVVLGQYVGEDPVDFRISGNYLGKERTFKFHFALDKATTRNAFVPRLWASRKIAVLIDAIRALGADSGTSIVRPGPAIDPKMKELVDEIVRLSKEFGILTEYTAFLAREGTDLSKPEVVLELARRNLESRAIATRVGQGAYNQDFNNKFQRGQEASNYRNAFLDQNLQRVEITNVQQVNDRAFYNRNGRWVDSRLVDKEASLKPDKVVQVGSEEFKKLVERLEAQGRAGTAALAGDVLMEVDAKVVEVRR